jgi:hypothetical protein
MPAGRPRIYASEQERRDHHNARRRHARRPATLAAISSPTHVPGSPPDPEDPHSPVFIYQDRVTMVTFPPGEPLSCLSESLHPLAILDPLDDNTPEADLMVWAPSEESDGHHLSNPDEELDGDSSSIYILYHLPAGPANSSTRFYRRYRRSALSTTSGVP